MQIFLRIGEKCFAMSFVGNNKDAETFSLTKLSNTVTFHGDEYSPHESNYSLYKRRSNSDHFTESIIV